MVAEVKGTTSNAIAAAAQRPAAAEVAAVKPPVQTPSGGSESVSLTSAASELRELEKAVKAAPDVDVDRVNKIRESISNGTYQIDNDTLAQNIMRQEMSLMAPGPTGGDKK
jgi:flagellar biosynthesis anti-sigma factor FlgM